ncbi:hypothetical protein Leryth_006284 [Lithospermum erythrorhizon]|nr:hypothetical protein Leryth_006284 [Lithospermum erythrorhizon]
MSLATHAFVPLFSFISSCTPGNSASTPQHIDLQTVDRAKLRPKNSAVQQRDTEEMTEGQILIQFITLFAARPLYSVAVGNGLTYY